MLKDVTYLQENPLNSKIFYNTLQEATWMWSESQKAGQEPREGGMADEWSCVSCGELPGWGFSAGHCTPAPPGAC